mgnify:CR=1 FL=1|tara:strand:- start:445 stop:675 length:231 start_codon:yes stop_codon:yes gene_type:complete
MSWEDILKEEDFDRRMKERYEASLKDGGGVDADNPIHVEVEKILKSHSYTEAEEIADRIKLRVKWLRKNAKYGGRD